MGRQNWMIYGATGFTGRLIAAEGVRRGHRPIVAGRRAEAVRRLAEALGCPWRSFALGDPRVIGESLADCSVLLNCAGPYSLTALPMVQACLETQVHYLDITGEFSVIECLALRGDQARRAGVVLIPAVGFGVVPSDCLAAWLSDRHPGASELWIAFSADRAPSRGTAKSMWDRALRGGYIRWEGRLERVPLAKYIWQVNFPSGRRHAISIPWGDIATAYYTTKISNIITYAAFPWVLTLLLRTWYRVAHPVDGIRQAVSRKVGSGTPPAHGHIPSREGNMPGAKLREALPLESVPGPLLRLFRNLGWKLIDRVHRNPSPEDLERARAEIVAELRREGKTLASGAVRTPGGYRLTVHTALAAVETVLNQAPPAGFWTPARAFGPEFGLQMPGVEIFCDNHGQA